MQTLQQVNRKQISPPTNSTNSIFQSPSSTTWQRKDPNFFMLWSRKSPCATDSGKLQILFEWRSSWRKKINWKNSSMWQFYCSLYSRNHATLWIQSWRNWLPFGNFKWWTWEALASKLPKNALTTFCGNRPVSNSKLSSMPQNWNGTLEPRWTLSLRLWRICGYVQKMLNRPWNV